MSSKLEPKLLQYEKGTPISTDNELIKAIESIIKEEESVPYENRDFDLIEEATEAILLLKKYDIVQLENSVEEITDKYFNEIQLTNTNNVKKIKNKSVGLKWLFPIAAIVSLLIVGAMVAYAMGIDLLSMTKQAYVKLVEKVSYENDSNELIVTEDFQTFDSVALFLESENYSNLFLNKVLDDIYTVKIIEVNNFGSYKSITVRMESNGDTHEIFIQTPSTADFSNLQVHKIGDQNVSISEYDGKHQGQFVYNGDLYTIVTSSYENLKSIIKSMG